MKQTPRHVHFIAIGGTGMGSLAGLVRARGIEVTGSDDALYPPMSTLLEEWRIPVALGFRAEHVLERDPDLVVIGNAVRPDNEEARAAIDEGLPVLSFPDALYQLAISGKHSIVVAGTHGKTTTTSLVSKLLHGVGWDPSLLVGGFSLDFGGSFREGEGDHFVVEGDEYDTAFFDKTPKFLHYGARTLIITSVEFDHADIYRDLDHVKQAFRQVVAGLPADGMLVAALDQENVRDVVANAPCRVVGYSVGEGGATGPRPAGWHAEVLSADERGTTFDVSRDGTALGRATVPMHGRVNVENALAALATTVELGASFDDAARALSEFRGVKRRQEVRGEARGVTVIDDFAHHPTAVAASIAAIRARFPGRRLLAVFEPRTNTSRRRVFQDAYARVFEGADRVLVAEVAHAPIYSATGEVTEYFSSDELVQNLRARGLDADTYAGPDAIVAELAAACAPGDVVLTMSNGDFGGIWERLLAALNA